MSGDVKLEPCPHCGSDSCRVIGGPGTRGGPKYWAGCDHCNGRAWGDSQGEAIAAWNRRSSSAAERAVVEALEMAEGTLLIASRMLTEDHKMVLNGKRWGDKTIKAVNAALSSVCGEGGDKQARPSGSAPISTDTKGTTK